MKHGSQLRACRPWKPRRGVPEDPDRLALPHRPEVGHSRLSLSLGRIKPVPVSGAAKSVARSSAGRYHRPRSVAARCINLNAYLPRVVEAPELPRGADGSARADSPPPPHPGIPPRRGLESPRCGKQLRGGSHARNSLAEPGAYEKCRGDGRYADGPRGACAGASHSRGGATPPRGICQDRGRGSPNGSEVSPQDAFTPYKVCLQSARVFLPSSQARIWKASAAVVAPATPLIRPCTPELGAS
jgi:hypothetical protein